MIDSRSSDASFDTKAHAPASTNASRTFGPAIGREHDHVHPGIRARHLAARRQRVDVRQVHIEHDDVRLESLCRLQQCAAVRDASHDLAVLCQQPADGFHDVRVVVRKQHAGSRGQH